MFKRGRESGRGWGKERERERERERDEEKRGKPMGGDSSRREGIHKWTKEKKTVTNSLESHKEGVGGRGTMLGLGSTV